MDKTSVPPGPVDVKLAKAERSGHSNRMANISGPPGQVGGDDVKSESNVPKKNVGEVTRLHGQVDIKVERI